MSDRGWKFHKVIYLMHMIDHLKHKKLVDHNKKTRFVINKRALKKPIKRLVLPCDGYFQNLLTRLTAKSAVRRGNIAKRSINIFSAINKRLIFLLLPILRSLENF